MEIDDLVWNWFSLFEHMSRWESRAEYRKICAVPPHPAARSGLWDIPAGDQLSFLTHEDDNTIWRVPEHDRLYGWVPAGPYEYSAQFRDILPIARVAQIYCGPIQWVRPLLEVPETGESLLAAWFGTIANVNLG